MPRTTETCHQAFQRGLEDRKAYSLSSGARRLREALDGPHRVRETINNIAEDLRFKRRRSSYPRPLGCCTSEEKATWLKSVPTMLAYDLGYNVIPAIRALRLDGVPDHVIRGCIDRAKEAVATIINQCEEARITLSYGIRLEYTRLRAGESTILPLVQSIEDLIEDALQDAEPWLKAGSQGGTANYPTQSSIPV
jgi:hypothetical protein